MKSCFLQLLLQLTAFAYTAYNESVEQADSFWLNL